MYFCSVHRIFFVTRLVTYPTGRYPYPGPTGAIDNSVWMMANPNWASINIHLGEVRAIINLVATCRAAPIITTSFRHVLGLYEGYDNFQRKTLQQGDR